ncbi:hypothetical protein EPUS_07343 [Endocarpon pusillum Z07020]|uniref:Uncharacterized protein n=1 Tax=Endocarpon pusillum (strain Z07020 / HMAS-L-300199) TaxID=1263415 RepID=U1FZV7_ENDPU|nr:uncharacterized protein EPUS_07343 [Endocarpon pusillum Z07020]ERF70487.1 hypothetical protein EPUS_07343 [Endocarpon pusillum Z07020]
MDYPRRSARLSPHASNSSQPGETSAAAFGRSSQTSSTTTTSYPSPTNDTRNEQIIPQLPQQPRYTPQLQVQPTMSQSHLHAPLPSPSAGEIDSCFARPHPQLNPYQSLHPQQQQQQTPTSQPLSDQNQRQSHHNSFSQNNNNFGQAGIMPTNFLAEAAKRAQMACLMRDLGDVSL